MKNKKENNGIIDLRSVDEDDSVEEEFSDTDDEVVFHKTPVEDDLTEVVASSKEVVRIDFEKFVRLVASHDLDEIVEKFEGEQVIITTGLLADLANAPEQEENKKSSLVFVIGLVVGLVLAWLLFKK